MNTVTLSAKIHIYPTGEQAKILTQSMKAYTQACNWISQQAFNDEDFFQTTSLQRKYYQNIRNLFGLKSQMAISAIRCVTAKYKTTNTQFKNNPWIYEDENTYEKTYIQRDVYWLQSPIEFKAPVLELQRARDWSFKKNGTLSLNTLNGRIEVPYKTKGFDKYFADIYKFGLGRVVKRNNRWYFDISVTCKVPEPNEYSHIVGIDRGLNNILSIYDDTGYSENVSGKDIQRKRNKYQRTRASLQKKRTKGAKRTLKRISGRENRYINDVNHCLSKTLVRKYGSDTLYVLENLSDIRSSLNYSKKLNNELSDWAFYDFEQKLKYKASLTQSTVINVDAAYTSQRCPVCGNIDKSARNRAKHLYSCHSCGFEENDDIIAAMNLRQLGDQWLDGVERPSFKKVA